MIRALLRYLGRGLTLVGQGLGPYAADPRTWPPPDPGPGPRPRHLVALPGGLSHRRVRSMVTDGPRRTR